MPSSAICGISHIGEGQLIWNKLYVNIFFTLGGEANFDSQPTPRTHGVVRTWRIYPHQTSQGARRVVSRPGVAVCKGQVSARPGDGTSHTPESQEMFPRIGGKLLVRSDF